MVYIMEFKVDGACRGNGQPGSTAVAAACLFKQNGSHISKVKYLADNDIVPTSQRAEILAIIVALEWALDKYPKLSRRPRIDVMIKSDSRYAVNSMTTHISRWIDNGWYNAAGRPVANRDLFQRALALENKISRIGQVKYSWISREENLTADMKCREALGST
ncbi:hypothetical protein TWF102_009029 [Orbilia oligospora]|uniref:ribonuclease H n=1 Tax=Orbilia oligospora TaxID=2813651 RepID=A0A7C8J337_ORBOL|nr:hypothetical protein TWF102_009029 [Orbilia oligospora]KAF3113935.1 hypothetical protein TWF706_009290 [Orbilia oligospora]KAF3116752.1 hypothetical protein TWF103_008506 [Orbilia oligospora]KAF3144970.1 hypothetical protein TWF594_004551 [Orbilia oligospora]